MKILLVEDNIRIARPLAHDLRQQQHVVDIAEDGMTGWELARSSTYDLILLDLMLPKLDGLSLCKKLRDMGCHALILMLTAKDTLADKVIGLDAGADDYLVKPFKLEELSARIRALSRRSLEVKPTALIHGKLVLDPASHCVSYDQYTLDLTPKEYMLLECLMKNPAQVFTRSMLLDKLWELDQVSGEGTIKTHINNLRRKLRQAGSPEGLIQTVYGIGYRLGLE